MIGWVVQVTIMSLCFIAVVHYLYVFFKTTLTVPKVKDLVNRPQQQYEELFKGIDLRNRATPSAASTTTTTSISALPPLPDDQYLPASFNSHQQQNAMKDELKQFLKKLNRN
jgi:hypothetical protein